MNKKLKRKQALIMAEPYRTPFNSKVAKVSGDVIEDSVGEIKYATSFDGATKIVDANKNLLALPDIEETALNGVTYSIKDGVITLNGTTTDIFNLKLENVVKVEENQTYYFYQKTENTTATFSLVSNINNYGEEPTFFQYNNNSKKMTKTSYLTLHLYITNTTTFENAKFYLMLVEGSTAPTEFEPNFKNLLEIGDLSERTKDGLTYYYKNGMIVVNGTSNGGYTHIYDNVLGAEYFEDGATYSFNDISNDNNLYLQFSLAKKDGTTQYLTKKNSFIWDSNIYSICYIAVQTAPTITTFNNIVIKPTFVKSSVIPSQFIPFVNPYFVSLGQNGSVQYNGLEPREIDLKVNVLSKINNQVSDKLSNYALTKNTKVVDLGSFDWSEGGTQTSGIIRWASNQLASDIVYPNATNIAPNLLCTRYDTITADQTFTKVKGITLDQFGNLVIYDPDYNTSDKLEAFKKAIRGTLLMYQTKNPTTINTTSFKTFKEDTNATISDDNFTSSPNAITETFKPTRSYDFKVNGFSNIVKSSNLLNIPDKANTTTNGITYSIKNGIITLNGTSTETIFISLISGLSGRYYSINCFNNASNDDLQIMYGVNGVAWNAVGLGTANASRSIDFLEEQTNIEFYIRINPNASLTNATVKPMLVSGSTIPSTFEPYFDPYIESFADKKNLLGYDDVNGTKDGLNYQIKNGVITLNGTTSVQGWNILHKLKNDLNVGFYSNSNFNDIPLKNSSLYLNTYGTSDNFFLGWQDINGKHYINENQYNEKTRDYLSIYINDNNTVVSNAVLKPMLIQGKTAPSTFLPYQDKYSAFLNVKGKNLIGLDNQTLEINGIKVQIKDDVITVNGISQRQKNEVVEIKLKNPINSGTYSFNAFTTVGSRIDVYVNEPLVSFADLSINTTKTNISLTSAINLVLFFPKGIQYDNRVFKPMLVSGSTAPTEFEPYYSFTKEVLINQPLRKFDYLTYDGVYRQTNEIVLDGTNNIYVDESSGIIQVLNIPNVDSLNTDWGINYASQLMVTTSNLPLIQSYLIQVEKQKGIGTNNGRIFIKLDDSPDNSLNNWTVEKVNNYFKQNPITITYKTVDQTFEATSLTRLLFKNGYNKITAFDSINNNAIVEYLEYYKSKGD